MQQRGEKHVRQPQHQDDQTPRHEEAGHDPAGAQSAHQGEERGEGLFFIFSICPTYLLRMHLGLKF